MIRMRCNSRRGGVPSPCHTRFSEENQVLSYMYARIKFHTYSDIIVYNRNNIT
jgi:hypothetical protein